MTDDDEPNIAASGKTQMIVVDGERFNIETYRLESDMTWTLEGVDKKNTRDVWSEDFASDAEALDAAIAAIRSEGAVVFMRGDNVVPFRR